MKRVTYLPAFEADLLEIWVHIAQDHAVAADRMIERLYERCQLLKVHPKAGAARPDIAKECRQLVEGPVLLLYRELPEKVEMVRALYAGRDVGTETFTTALPAKKI